MGGVRHYNCRLPDIHIPGTRALCAIAVYYFVLYCKIVLIPRDSIIPGARHQHRVLIIFPVQYSRRKEESWFGMNFIYLGIGAFYTVQQYLAQRLSNLVFSVNLNLVLSSQSQSPFP